MLVKGECHRGRKVSNDSWFRSQKMEVEIRGHSDIGVPEESEEPDIDMKVDIIVLKSPTVNFILLNAARQNGTNSTTTMHRHTVLRRVIASLPVDGPFQLLLPSSNLSDRGNLPQIPREYWNHFVCILLSLLGGRYNKKRNLVPPLRVRGREK